MDRFTAMSTFVRVIELGSLSAAARDLGVSQPAISQQVMALEKELGVRLLNRSTRKLSLTEVGEGYYARVKKILESVVEAEDALALTRSQLTGNLRIHAPVGFGQMHLAPITIAFLAAHPELKVELILDDRFSDLVESGVDVAIRFGELKSSSLVVRKLGTLRRILVASPSYVAKYGNPVSHEEIIKHRHVRFSWSLAGNELQLVGPDGPVSVPTHANFMANNAFALTEALCSGVGIGAAQVSLVHHLLDNGSLIQVMPRYSSPTTDIHAVYPAAQFIPRKVRVFVDYMASELGKIPGLK
jgi:DNA-binding transcriptional LysR family regulator